MRLDNESLSFSPTDLAAFSSCRQRSLLDRLKAQKRASFNVYPDPLLELLQLKGYEHEKAYLDQQRAEGKRVVAFPVLEREERNPEGYRRRAEQTREAMIGGADVIYQGTFYDEHWLGLVDFLLRKDDLESDLGSFSYEVLDAKLAREAKATAIFQCCVYSDLLEQAQGVRPREIHLYLGGPTPRQETFRLAHFGAYYRALKQRFLKLVGDENSEAELAPEPVDSCRICHWAERCQGERVDVDHLSLVAGIVRDQRFALEAVGVSTLASLAERPLEPTPEGLRAVGFQRIREQARVQLEKRRRGSPYFELLPSEKDESGRGLGLAALPEPSPHDWFFDLETASLATDDGLEYLWGVSYVDDAFDADWVFTASNEKRALRAFLERATQHVAEHPGAHIYHFGHKEPSTLKRLVARYGVGTEELDDLLRSEVFVDLHRIVKQGILAGVTSYSLKLLEPLYGFEREVPLVEANRARGVLEQALSLQAEGRPIDETRPVVEGYNRDDCISTRVLRDWLEERRLEREALDGRALGRPVPRTGEEERRDESELAEEVRQLMEGLLAGVPDEREERTAAEHVRWLLAHLLEWHRREDKNWWWEYYRLRDLSADELIGERKPLAKLEYERCLGPVDKSLLYRFRFPPQEHGIKDGRSAADLGSEKVKSWNVWSVDDEAGTLDLKVGTRKDAEKAAALEEEIRSVRRLAPNDLYNNKPHRKRLRESARLLLEGEEALRSWSPASLALLRADPPHLLGGHSLTEIGPESSLLERAREAALTLDEGVLPVQGPPGTGKTFAGARMIRALLRAGRRVGVTAGSHKVITNLLNEVCGADEDDMPTPVVGLQVGKKDRCVDERVSYVDTSSKVGSAVAKREKEGEPPFNLIAGVSWLWCGDTMAEDPVDVLFIDEAGQFSLANALAVAPAARNLVLLGDPQQLNQPMKGAHPPGTEVSVLEHLAGEDGILSPEQGLFLDETWRMRPEITRYTSELFYKGQLRHRPHLEDQLLVHPESGAFHGLFHVPVQHEGNSQESPEEADAVVALFRQLLSPKVLFTNPMKGGGARGVTCADLLVLAPYNAQVDLLRETLAAAGFPDAHVGTVDKFQGQEAAVAIYSLASSSATEAPRGMDFLYALDRLNVATSRARCATIVVSSPAVMQTECRTPKQIRMVNAFVRFGEMGEELAGFGSY